MAALTVAAEVATETKDVADVTEPADAFQLGAWLALRGCEAFGVVVPDKSGSGMELSPACSEVIFPKLWLMCCVQGRLSE